MKKAKKRALLSSVAMLVVSAVVLSSATFAWFVAGDTATITGIDATIDAGSSVQVSRNRTGPWLGTLTSDALEGYRPSGETAALLAASTGPSVSGDSFYTGELDNNGVFSATALTDAAESLGTHAFKFDVYVKSSVAGSVTLEGTTFTAGVLSKAVFCAIVEENKQAKIYNAAGSIVSGAYNGITAPIEATDTGNGIIETGEISPAVAGALQPVSTLGNIEDFAMTFANPQDVIKLTFYVWLEGQHADCVGTKSTAMNMALQFNKPA